jgi:hypothetical protein
MSMVARFVQVTPARLAQIRQDHSSVVDLFEESSLRSPKPLNGLSETIRDRAQPIAPRALAASLAAMDPVMRELAVRGLESQGISLGAIESGEGADALLGVIARGSAPDSHSNLVDEGLVAPVLALEKSWHGLHYLLCGEVEPGPTVLSQAVIGGLEIGDDYGYGPARYFSPMQVATVARELNRPKLESEMRSRFNARRMSSLEIYPKGWSPADATWLLNEFRRLRNFYDDASARQCAVVTCIL